MSVTLALVIITGLISYQAFTNPAMKAKLLHRPVEEHRDKEYYRLLTHGFIHADWTHLLINMYVLYMFGEMVERYFTHSMGGMKGRMAYLFMYLATIVAASLYTHFKHKNNPYYAALGASGATSGIMFAFALFDPWAILLLFFILPCPAIVAAVLYLVYSSWASKNSRDNIGHDAHFWGAVFGFLFTIALNPPFFSQFVDRLVNDMPF